MTVGEKIKEFIEDKFPNRIDYKSKLGMSYGAMHKYFTNQRLPGYLLLYRLKKIGFDVNSIFNENVYQDTVDNKEMKDRYNNYA